MSRKAGALTHLRHRYARIEATPWAARSSRGITLAAAAAVVLIAFLSVGIGSVAIPSRITVRLVLAYLGLVAPDPALNTFATILFAIRLPRVALVAFTGAALASSGAAYQGLFRNPLADPYIIGVAAGAALGAVLGIVLRLTYPFVALAFIPGSAFVGALLTVALVYALGSVGRSTPTTTLILAGVAVSSLATSLMTFLLLRSGSQLVNVLAFLLGGTSGGDWGAVRLVAVLCACGFGVLYVYARPLNVLLFDEDQARQLGIDVARVKLIVIVAATLITAAAVAFSGLIGFVGLVVPHVARLLVGPDHRRLLPLTALGGAAFLMLTDLLARTLIAPEELPLGVVTALIGAPFFLFLLRRAKRAAFL